MSKTNSIQPFATRDATLSSRRTHSVASTQSSFEEELLKIQFFETQVEPSPLLPIAPATPAEKVEEANSEPENSDSSEKPEANESTGEYVYGVIPQQLPIVAEPDPETHSSDIIDTEIGSDAAADIDVAATQVDEKSPDQNANVIALEQSTPDASVEDKPETAIVPFENNNVEQSTFSSHDAELSPHEKEQVETVNLPAASQSLDTTPVHARQVESDSTNKEPDHTLAKKQSKDNSKIEVASEATEANEEADHRDAPIIEKNDTRTVAEATPFQSTDNSFREPVPQENRRSQRLERNRLDTEPSVGENTGEQNLNESSEFRSTIESSIEPIDLAAVPPEQTTVSTTESISNSVVVSTPQSNLNPIPSSLSIPAGLVANAPLNSSPSTPQSTGAVSVTNTISNSSSTSASRETTGTSRANLTPYQESKLVQRVLRGMEQLGNGGGQVRIRLHPPELGTLQMTLKFEATQVTAQFEVENRVARDALLGNSQILKDRLKEQGLEVQKFEVEVRSDVNDSLNSSAGERQGQGHSPNGHDYESRFAVSNNNRINPDARFEQTPSTTPWVRTKGSLDVSA